MEKKNNLKLMKALVHLPQHEPHPDLWVKIEASLGFEDRLQGLIPELPPHEPGNFLWDKIEAKLEPVKETKLFRMNSYYRYFAAAASVLLLLASFYVVKIQSRNKVILTYSEELVVAEQVFPLLSQDNNEGLRFIQEQCSRAPEICARPEFKELQLQLEQLEEENKKLKQQIEVFGEDPALIKNQIKLENLRAECTKELIQIIIS